MFDFVARAKYDAWKRFGGLSFRDARNLYIQSVEDLKVGWSREGEYEYTPTAEEIKVKYLFFFFLQYENTKKLSSKVKVLVTIMLVQWLLKRKKSMSFPFIHVIWLISLF